MTTSPPELPFLSGLFPEEIAERYQLRPYQGRQIFQWIHRKGASSFEKMTNLPKELRERLSKETLFPATKVSKIQGSSASGTRKALLLLADNECIESVLIPDRNRYTVCVSSQVGCPLKCAFCATGLSGYRRNLNAAEIVEQVVHLRAAGELPESAVCNIVYMGMGEPFYNYDEVRKSIRILMHPEGLGTGARHITVSTAGDVKGIERFAAEEWQVRLSVSLHAAQEEKRSQLVPLNRKFGLQRLHAALREYNQHTGRKFTLEWTLLDGVNDTEDDARDLVRFTRGLDASVNLIPWNPVAGLPYRPSPPAACEAFQAQLTRSGVRATLRREKGRDIDAACGQLRRSENGDGVPPEPSDIGRGEA
ncbi:MAG: 23S rRNA (adenine(2503)-C(2))-methyltransferase RlmN [Candidatus Hydrogenedentes bacterium]|nr:23S rRNA (adenine(2503)-C(2))-methyltransferase RlmN [Candidatus Hydrogenedentota bacterium]